MKNKIYSDFAQAVTDISDGSSIMLHVFTGLGGIPQNLIRALLDQGTKDLILICCAIILGWMNGRLLPGVLTPNNLVEAKRVKKVVTGWVSTKRWFGIESALEKAVAAGEVEVELTSHGILAERIRAGGAGIGGFYSPIGIGTVIEHGKEKKVINGREYILELPLRANFSLVRAHKADKMGNLIYRGTSRGWNPIIAMAGDVTIAEVDEIVEVGALDPEHIITPGFFVDRIVEIPKEKRTPSPFEMMRLVKQVSGYEQR